jgi:hypothetical protein
MFFNDLRAVEINHFWLDSTLKSSPNTICHAFGRSVARPGRPEPLYIQRQQPPRGEDKTDRDSIALPERIFISYMLWQRKKSPPR